MPPRRIHPRHIRLRPGDQKPARHYGRLIPERRKPRSQLRIVLHGFREVEGDGAGVAIEKHLLVCGPIQSLHENDEGMPVALRVFVRAEEHRGSETAAIVGPFPISCSTIGALNDWQAEGGAKRGLICHGGKLVTNIMIASGIDKTVVFWRKFVPIARAKILAASMLPPTAIPSQQGFRYAAPCSTRPDREALDGDSLTEGLEGFPERFCSGLQPDGSGGAARVESP